MVGIPGIGPVDGTGEPVPTQKRTRERTPPSTGESDAVQISSEAAQAADATRLVRQSQEIAQNEYRQQRIEEAKQNIAEGAHRLQSVVLEIASRITGYVGQ